MRKAIYVLLLALIVTMIAVSCSADPVTPEEETVSVTFFNSGRNISSELEGFQPGEYYWKYAAEKADDSKLTSGATESYTEEGARFIHENASGLVGNLSGFSQGWWNFKLFGYKRITTETGTEYVLVYQGEAKNQLLTNNGNGVNKVTVYVNPITTNSTKTGILYIDYANLTFVPSQSGLSEEDIASFNKKAIVKALGAETEFIPAATDAYGNALYSLTPGAYDVSLYIEKNGIIYSTESIVTTVYQGLQTKLQGELKESLTHFSFDSQLNPDIITSKITSISVSSSSIPEGGLILNQDDEKVSATIPGSVASSYIETIIRENSAAGATAENTSMTMSVNVQTTEASNGSLTFEIGMSANITIKNGENIQTISDSVSTLSDYITTKVKLQSGLDNVTVKHKGNDMSTDLANPNEYGAYSYDSETGYLTIKTKSFSPFSVTYEVKLGYDITFDYNDGITQTKTVRAAYWQDLNSLKIEDPIRDGYVFKGWFYNGEAYNPWRTFSGDITLRAEWADFVTVTIISQFGNEKIQVARGEYLNYRPESKDPDLSFHHFETEDGKEWLYSRIYSDITLHARFEKKEIYVWYNYLNDEYIGYQNYFNGENTVEPETPSKNGMNFIGWFTNKEGEHLPENKYVFGNPITENLNLYAVFDKEPYTVTYMSLDYRNSESYFYQEFVYENDCASNVTGATSSLPYYELDYWKTEDGIEFDFNTPIESDLTLYPALKIQEGKEAEAICTNGFMKEEYYDYMAYENATVITLAQGSAVGFSGSIELGMNSGKGTTSSSTFTVDMDLANGVNTYKLENGRLAINFGEITENGNVSEGKATIEGSIKAQIGKIIPKSTDISCDLTLTQKTVMGEVSGTDNYDKWIKEAVDTLRGSLSYGDKELSTEGLSVIMKRDDKTCPQVLSIIGSFTVTNNDNSVETYSFPSEEGVTIILNESGYSISGKFTKTIADETTVYEIVRFEIVMGKNGITVSGEMKKDDASIDPNDPNSLFNRIMSEIGNILSLQPVLMGYEGINGVSYKYIRNESLDVAGFGSMSISSEDISEDTTKYHVKWNISNYTDYTEKHHRITGEWEFNIIHVNTEQGIFQKFAKESLNYISPLTIDGILYDKSVALGDGESYHGSIIYRSMDF